MKRHCTTRVDFIVFYCIDHFKSRANLSLFFIFSSRRRRMKVKRFQIFKSAGLFEAVGARDAGRRRQGRRGKSRRVESKSGDVPCDLAQQCALDKQDDREDR